MLSVCRTEMSDGVLSVVAGCMFMEMQELQGIEKSVKHTLRTAQTMSGVAPGMAC